MLGFSAGRGAVAVGVTTSLVLLVVLSLLFAFSTASTAADGEGRNALLASNRKLLLQGGGHHGHGHGHGGVEAVKPERIGTSCSKDDVVVYQGPTSPLPNGIPTYTVQILNVCVSGCAVSRIHLSCGWFSSARLINPRLFRRLSFDDCLVNDGMPLPKGGTVSFQYANSFHYPLSVSSISCLPSST